MEIAVVVLLAVIVVFLLVDRLLARKRWKEQSDTLSKAVSDKVESSIGMFGELKQEVGKLSAQATEMQTVGRSISALQEALRAPKFRGGFGELGLESLLRDCLPSECFTIQHHFSNGEAVDAVVKIAGCMVPIDSKFPFPLDEFQRMMAEETEAAQSQTRRQFIRTIKKHVDDVSKYIRPDENTFNFALMYVPAENVYYQMIIRSPENTGLYSYCLEKRVFPVSPSSFYAYLEAIVLGLRGLQVERQAGEILRRLQRLQSDLEDFQNDYQVLGGHIQRASGKYQDALRKLQGLGDRLERLEQAGAEKLPPGASGDSSQDPSSN
jgi:DNA recombination protein RmuC